MDSQRPRLPAHQQLIRSGRWPLVGETQPRNDDQPWTVTIAGNVRQTRVWTLDEIAALPQIERKIDIHCVTRWSKFDMTFGGVALSSVLPQAIIEDTTKFVSFKARSERRHSTSLTLEDLLAADAMLATSAEGGPLSPEHGGPIRMVVPGKYFYKSVKWVERIECLVEDQLGYWEADAGYHNGADPWLEQRYMAPGLSKQDAARLVELRDFSELDLRSIDASQRDLTGLLAHNAQLRDANFRAANLAEADFRGANLSNAHFQGSNLRGARFQDADIEGANFAGADLRGTDLRVASMFGASFCEVDDHEAIVSAAKLDTTTQFDRDKLAALTEIQRQLFGQL